MAHPVDNVLRVMDAGWEPYGGQVDGAAYQRLGCPRPTQARWFTQGCGRYLCLGCDRQCAPASSEGFQLVLTLPKRSRRLAFGTVPVLSVGEFMRSREGGTLRVDETAWVLGLSERKVRDLLDMGDLTRVGEDTPVRITHTSVAAMLTVDEG